MMLSASEAHASVSFAVDTDRLVTRAELVLRATALDSYAAWEGTRIVTYSKLHVDETIAGSTKDSEVWVRSLGGQVDHLGQWVDGEPVFNQGQSSLVFLSKDEGGAYVSVARAQGQIPLSFDAKKKTWLAKPNPYIGMLVPRPETTLPSATNSVQTTSTNSASTSVKPLASVAPRSLRPAVDELSGKSLDELRSDLSARWGKAHRP